MRRFVRHIAGRFALLLALAAVVPLVAYGVVSILSLQSGTRREVIQGNNRAIGIKKHYQGGKGKYREQLISQAQQLGIDPAQVQGMKNPVLVREVKVDDATAIELGNYDVKDLETGGQRRIDPVATSRRIPFAEKQKIADFTEKRKMVMAEITKLTTTVAS